MLKIPSAPAWINRSSRLERFWVSISSARYLKQLQNLTVLSLIAVIHALGIWLLFHSTPIRSVFGGSGSGSISGAAGGNAEPFAVSAFLLSAPRADLPVETATMFTDAEPAVADVTPNSNDAASVEAEANTSTHASSVQDGNADLPGSSPVSGEGLSDMPPGLWEAIEPCWTRLAGARARPVTLKVDFSPLGNLASHPVILVDSGLTDKLTESEIESIATDALSQCGPYTVAFGQKNIIIQFPGAKK